MAITDVNLAGYVRSDNGDPVSGITVSLMHASTDDGAIDGSDETTTTTNSNGYWSFTETSLDANYDIKITSDGGGQIRYIPWVDEITLKTVDTSVMKVRGASNTAAAPIYLFADLATDAGDGWRIQATDSDTLAIGSDKASAGTIIDYITVTNGANAAASNTTILGQLTIGVDDTGADVKFFGATSGQYLLWDESADELVLAGDTKLSFHDAAGGENIIASANGHLEVNSGTTLDITAPTVDLNSSTEFNIDTAIYDLNASGAVTIDAAGLTTITGTNNAVGTIYLRANAGTSETVKIHSDQGTSVTQGAESVTILSDAGGVGIRSTANLANAVNITVDGGTTSSMTLFNDQGTSVTEGSSSIQLLSDAGGVELKSTANLAKSIKLIADGGTSETIYIQSDLGTSESSIQLLSDAGGIDIDAATGKDVDIAGGTVNLTSSDDAASAIYLRANAGTSETIVIHADQGSGAASIKLLSDAGGITLSGAPVTVTGHLLPSADDTYDLGSASAAWQDLFLEGDITLTDAGTITTSGGALTLDATTDVIVPSGTGLLVGHTANLVIGGQNPEAQIVGGGIADNVLAIMHFGGDADRPAAIYAGLSRNGSKGSHTIVQDGDQVFAINAYGSSGTGFDQGAAYRIEVDGTPGATTDMPMRHVFLTSPDGSATIVERMRISAAGHQLPGADSTYTVGATGSVYLEGWFDSLKADAAITLDATTDVIVPSGTGLLVGHTSNLVIGGQNPEAQIVGGAIADNVLAMAHFGGDANRPASIYAALSRNASKGSHTIVQDDDQIFAINAYGSNGTHFNYPAAAYRIEVDGTPGVSSDMPGRHVWLNSPDGSATLAETMRLDNAGDLLFPSTTIKTTTGDLDLTSAGNMDITVQGGAAASLKISDGTTNILYPDWRTNVGTVAWMTWQKGATGFASHADLTPWFFRLIAFTMTLTGTNTVTAMNGVMMEIGAQTITDTSTVTITKASSLYIKNVVAAGEVTITNNYAIDTEAGAFLTSAGVWTDNPSTLAKKNDVLDISPASLRGAIRTIHPRQWIYKDEWNDAGQQRYGIVAEELPGFLKPLGSTQNDVVQPSIMAGFALAGVHHLEDRITQLEAQLAALS